MKYQLKTDADLAVEKRKIGRVPALILRSANRKPINVGLLWIHD